MQQLRWLLRIASSLKDGVEQAAASIDSGAAKAKVEGLQRSRRAHIPKMNGAPALFTSEWPALGTKSPPTRVRFFRQEDPVR